MKKIFIIVFLFLILFFSSSQVYAQNISYLFNFNYHVKLSNAIPYETLREKNNQSNVNDDLYLENSNEIDNKNENNEDITILIIDLCITALTYLILPFIRFYRSCDYNNHQIKFFLILNSIIITICYIILSALIGIPEKVNFLPPFIYYYVNSFFWKNKENI